jgi:phosphoribosyl-AMP cyclohydrolase
MTIPQPTHQVAPLGVVYSNPQSVTPTNGEGEDVYWSEYRRKYENTLQ